MLSIHGRIPGQLSMLLPILNVLNVVYVVAQYANVTNCLAILSSSKAKSDMILNIMQNVGTKIIVKFSCCGHIIINISAWLFVELYYK